MLPKSFVPDKPTGLPSSFVPDAPEIPDTPVPKKQSNILDPTTAKDDNFIASLARTTIGSSGIAGVGQGLGRSVAGMWNAKAASEANEGIRIANAQLSHVTDALLAKVKSLPEGDPKREMLLSQVRANVQQLGLAGEEMGEITKTAEERQTSVGEIAGTALNATLTILPFLKVSQVASAVRTAAAPSASLWEGVLATTAKTLKPLIQTPVFGTQGVKAFFTAAGKRALQTGLQFGGFSTANGLIEDKEADEIATDASLSFGLGVLGSGLFSTFITAPLTAATSQDATSRLFRFGLGFSRATQKAEERENKMASEILIREGAGTARGLKAKYEKLAGQSEDQIQREIKNYMASTKKGGTFRTEDVLREIEEAYKKQFPNSLSKADIQAFMDSLPLDVLRRKAVVNVAELNQLRREITNKMISPTTFTRGDVKEGTARQLLTAGGVLAEKVKGTVRATRPIFEKYSAYMKGIDAALNTLGTTHGPVNTGARIAGASAGALVGFGLGSFLGAGIGITAEELARSTVGRTALASMLRKLGYAGSALSDQSISAFGEMLMKAGVIKGFDL